MASAAPPLDTAALRRCLGTFVTGVTVVTTRDREGRAHGLTANSFSSVSLEPPLVLWSLRRQAYSFPVFDAAESFAFNILSADQIDIAKRFASAIPDRFEGVAVSSGLYGLPLIDGCSAHIECTTEARHAGGDHVIFVGRVRRISTSDRPALAFGGGRYMVAVPHEAASLT